MPDPGWLLRTQDASRLWQEDSQTARDLKRLASGGSDLTVADFAMCSWTVPDRFPCTGHLVAPADLGPSLAWGRAASLPPLRVPFPGTEGRFRLGVCASPSGSVWEQETGRARQAEPRTSWNLQTHRQTAVLWSFPALWEWACVRHRRDSGGSE